jgi:hypothetical protein
MEAKFQRVVYEDVWRLLNPSKLGDKYAFQNSAIGWRFEATHRERLLITENKLRDAVAVVLLPPLVEARFTMAYALAQGFIPYVTSDIDEQLEVQAVVTAAAAKWTIFLETLTTGERFEIAL